MSESWNFYPWAVLPRLIYDLILLKKNKDSKMKKGPDTLVFNIITVFDRCVNWGTALIRQFWGEISQK
jgi:hypothetical protein